MPPYPYPSWVDTVFGLPEEYHVYESASIFNYSLASTENQYPQTYEKINAMPSNHPLALVIEPLLGKDVDPLDVNETDSSIIERQNFYANEPVRLQYIKVDQESRESEGMTLTQCVIRIDAERGGSHLGKRRLFCFYFRPRNSSRSSAKYNTCIHAYLFSQ